MHPPTLCGLATFSAGLSGGLRANGVDASVVRIADGSATSDTRVIGELVNGCPTSAAATLDLLNQGDVAIVQHEYGMYGGADGDEVVDIVGGLRIPSIVVAHTILKNPTPRQRWVLETIAATAGRVVVMSEVANERLRLGYDIDHRKIVMIPHGAAVSANPQVKRSGRPTLLTWGLLSRGKGVERVIDVMDSVRGLPGRPRYLVAGRTHPRDLAVEGEAYRDALREQAQRRGVADAVNFDSDYRDLPSLTGLIQSAAAVVLPYDCTDQANSGVLVEAIANGRPVVATAFPHAVELLSSGAGIVVDHGDPDALASALHRVLSEPRLAGSMAAEARLLAPTMAWRAVSKSYLSLARRVCSEWSALI